MKRTSAAISAALVLAGAGLMGAASAQAAPTPLPAVEGVPILAQTWLGNTGGGSAVLTVHGVRRVAGGTVVYFSMGVPKGAPADQRRFFSTYGGGFWNTLTVDSDAAGTQCAVSALDLAGGKAYSSLKGEDRNACLGTKMIDFAAPKDSPNAAVVAWSILAPLPKEVSTVDLFIGQQLLSDVPVEDGLMEPVAADPVPVVGMGWPKIDLALIKTAVKPEASVFPLTVRVEDLAKKVTEAQTETGKTLEIPANVLFDYDKSDLTTAAAAIDDAAAKIIAAAKTGTVTVTGHTDSDGDDAYNQALSERRAQAVVAALQAKVPGITFTAVGKGETDPIADNGSETGRALNRRVTITLPK